MWRTGNEEFSDFGVLAINLEPLTGYSDQQIAVKLNVNLEEWKNSKELLQKSHHGELPLIAVIDDNVIAFPHWPKYQKEYDRQKKYRDPHMKELHHLIQERIRAEVTARGYKQELQEKVTTRIENREKRIEKREQKGSSTYVELFQTSWNAQPRLPRINKMTKGRIRKLQLRRKDEEFCAEWEAAIAALARTPFYTGENDSGWRATVDWFLKNDENWRKPLEQVAPKPNKYAHLCETDEKPVDVCPPTPEFKEMLDRLAKEKDMNGQ